MAEKTIRGFDDVALNVRDEGDRDAPAVLLSHSLGGALQQWDSLTAALAPRFRVVRWDSRGHGRSAAPAGPYNVEMLGRDALAVMDALGVKSAHYVGLSKGAMAGMWLAINAPDRIQKLVLANTTAFIPAKDHWQGLMETARTKGMAPIAGPTVEGWLGATYKANHPEGVKALVGVMAAMSAEGYVGSAAVLRDVDLREAVKAIRAQTLVVAGLEDTRGGPAAEFLAGAIPGARRLDVPAAGHLSPLENPSAFNTAILEFLA